MSLEEQIQQYKELARKIAELEEQKKGLSLLILEQMTAQMFVVGGYTVRRYDRLFLKLRWKRLGFSTRPKGKRFSTRKSSKSCSPDRKKPEISFVLDRVPMIFSQFIELLFYIGIMGHVPAHQFARF